MAVLNLTPWDSGPTIAALLARLGELFRPRQRLSVSQWAEQRRRLSPEASAQKGGKFSFALAPWQREVCDAPDDPEVGGVVLMWASQVTGKTETVNNMVGHTIDVDPCPMMVLQPSVKPMGEAWSKDRLAPMLRDTPALRGKVKEKRQRDSDNTVLHKRFPGGAITIAGANSPAGLASRPIRKGYFDEVDRYPSSAGKEGDPVSLAKKRLESFPDAVWVMTSTPTIKGLSRIEKEFDESDKCYWFCPCPKCGYEQSLKWGQVKWEKETDHGYLKNWYECESGQCRAHLTDADRQAMIRAGHWVATAPFNGVRGYHLNGLYCLFRPNKPFKDRLTQAIKGFLEANRIGPDALRAWVNTFLAETWEEPTERPPEAKVLYERREEYDPEQELPEHCCVIVGAADVQADRIEAEAVGYGPGEESWGIERITFAGSPQQAHVWELLDEWLQRSWKHPSGQMLKITCFLIDRGHLGKSVDDFTRARNARRVWSCSGSNTEGSPLVSRPMRTTYKRTVAFKVGTDVAKGIIMQRLGITRAGPRAMHFPKSAGYDLEYFEQLTGEYIVTEFADGKISRQWMKRRMRNEALDIRVYATAALEVLRPNLEILARNLATKSKHDKPTDAVVKEYELEPDIKPPALVTKPQNPLQRLKSGFKPARGAFATSWKK